MTDYIFCDLDGPILDGKLRHYNCYRDIVLQYGGEPISIERYWLLKRNKIQRTMLLELTGFKGSYDEYFTSWIDLIEQKKYLEYDVLKPDVHKTLLKWSEDCENLYIVTQRQNRENLIWQLSNLDIKKYFNKILTCPPGIEGSKYYALKDIAFNKAIMIGDTEEDMMTAKRLGISSIAIKTGLREKKYLDANVYVDEIKDIDITSLLL